jgi:hypothetical protein
MGSQQANQGNTRQYKTKANETEQKQNSATQLNATQHITTKTQQHRYDKDV